nr:glycosyltransferase [Candidatus Stoquefichus sp. SB1]
MYIVKGRVGKTIVQNQARKICSGEIIAFSDANSLWKDDSLYWLISRFKDKKIGYISGNLQYINSSIDNTSYAESSYWNFDLKIREMESSISNIVGGNGSIYAIRNEYYIDLPPLLSHDGFMPTKMVINGYNAKSEPMAIAFEKASEDSNDEFQRKIRMQRGQPFKKYYDIKKFNVFKYGWFTYFYIGHKYLKYLLYLFHPVLLIVNYVLLGINIFYDITFYMQLLFYFFALVGYFLRNKETSVLFYLPYHYCLTIVAQVFSIKNTLLGKSKATWEKSKTTRQ